MSNLAYAIEWKLKQLGLFDGANIQTAEGVLTFWQTKSGMKQPDDNTLQQWISDYEDYLLQQKTVETSKGSALKAKLKLTDDDLKTLAGLIENKS